MLFLHVRASYDHDSQWLQPYMFQGGSHQGMCENGVYLQSIGCIYYRKNADKPDTLWSSQTIASSTKHGIRDLSRYSWHPEVPSVFRPCSNFQYLVNYFWKTLQKVVIACNNQSAKAPQLCEFHTHGWMRSKVKMRKRQERKEHTFSINRQTYWQILHHFSMLFFPFSMGNLVGKLPSARQYWIPPTWWGSQTDPVVIFRALRGKSPKSRCF